MCNVRKNAANHDGSKSVSDVYKRQGPGADIIAKMGIKTEARKIMREAGLPIVPGTETPVQGIEEVKKVAKEVGYPIMLKALAGGGGKGMRLVRSEEEAETALRLSQSEAGTSFGNDAVYIEKYIENPHHIEVQIMGDKYGNVVHLGERECSIQRRNQKAVSYTHLINVPRQPMTGANSGYKLPVAVASAVAMTAIIPEVSIMVDNPTRQITVIKVFFNCFTVFQRTINSSLTLAPCINPPIKVPRKSSTPAWVNHEIV